MKRPFSRQTNAPSASDGLPSGISLPRPERATYVVGDVHGRADLLEPLLTRIDADIGQIGARDPQLVFVGDYIDRGPDSAEVLARMRDLTAEFPANVTCLMGNHERMLIDFLDDPAHRGTRWLRAGGEATLLSYAIAPPAGAKPDAATLTSVARALLSALPDGLVHWLRNRPLSWQSGNLWVVHAAAHPEHAMEDQSPRILLWGHPEFGTTPRKDDVWIAHGHTEIAEPEQDDGRINVDTGAWQSGKLTACGIRPDGGTVFLET